MAVGFKVDIFFYETGHPDFLHSFFQQYHIIQSLKGGVPNI
ncbi:hypothetical protein BACCIP111899_02468 [Bacillus rhizoplanae]|uniref:Uncharacterized protein n=1 Tax=Bacillus rhizoplanae TaxID=2880966 RepID=A0ABM8YC11_9BACI|nr:hypothetical protein BACCIP111899_02468 [Bacillus rhizoplanae]